MTLGTLQNSVITQTELSYQWRAQTGRDGLWRRGYIAVMTILALYSIVVGIVALSVRFDQTDVVRLILLFFYWMLVALHFGLMLLTLHLSAAAITREKRNTERWEALLLTGVSGREIVFGKWWATVRTMWRDYLFLAFLRASAVITLYNLGRELLPMLDDAPYSATTQPSLLSILAGVTVVFVLTMVSLPYTAACGVMAAMDAKRGAGLARGLAARTVFTILTAVIPVLLWHLIGYVLLMHIGLISRYQQFDVTYVLAEYLNTLLDNGFSLGGYLVINPPWVQDNRVGIGLAVVLVLMAYTGLTWALLRFAQWRAERSGALDTRETKGTA
jgi:hypothetical protein